MKSNRTRFKVILAVTLMLSCVFANTAKADDKLKLKSEGLAWALGLDPIPGDALFYAGKPIQGTINLLLGGFSGALMTAVIIDMVNCNSYDKNNFCDLAYLLIVPTGLIYLTTIIWDGAVGIKGVYEHNEKVRQQASIWKSFQPMISINENGGMVGAQFKF